MSDLRKYVQAQPFTLAGSGSSVGDGSLVLTKFTQIDGTLLTMANFGTKGYSTVEPGSSAQEEAITFTGVVQNANGTAALTGVSSQSFVSPYTETANLQKSHAGGVTMVITNTAGFYDTFANKDDDETILGLWQFPNDAGTPVLGASYVAPTLPPQIASKGYVDSVAVSGAPNADTVTKGIVQIATGAQLAAGTAIGSTGASVVPNGGSFKNTSAGAADANKVPVLNGSGVLDSSFVVPAPNATTTVKGVVELATGAETFAGTATGGTGANLVPANSTFIGTSSGAADSNKVPVAGSFGALATGFTYQTGTSGEAFSVGAGLYLKASDSKLYKAQGTVDEKTFSFCGVAIDAAAGADSPVRFASPGQIATGLSGLTAGSYYYVTDTAGTLGTTPGTRFAKVGQAMSTTAMRVIEPKFIVSGNFSYINTTPSPLGAQTVGFYPEYITFKATASGGSAKALCVGDQTSQINLIDGGQAILDTSPWRVGVNGVGTSTGSISSQTATTFVPAHSTSANIGTITVYWVAQSL